MKSSLLVLSITTLLSAPAFAHGNVDVSKGSQIEVFMANEKHHDHHSDGDDKAYGFEAVFMNEQGYFIYAEGETGAHQFYQLGGGKYFNVNEKLGAFVYGAYAQGGYLDSNELRARVGLDYQANHHLALHARLGLDYGNSKVQLDGDHDHDHAYHSHDNQSYKSQVGRADIGFSYDIGHVAEFAYNYVIQQQFESNLVQDNDTNLHYEARLTYTDSTLKPYVEYRQTNKAFDEHHFEESAVQFGIGFNF
ncbi:hypothetical protein [Motilimonas pumila]|nr:hypothetical protein [Motilimonas pumila]